MLQDVCPSLQTPLAKASVGSTSVQLLGVLHQYVHACNLFFGAIGNDLFVFQIKSFFWDTQILKAQIYMLIIE